MDQDLPPVPSDYSVYPSLKEKIEEEGILFSEHFCFQYISYAGERTIRTVRSTHILFTESDAYLVGFCELRNEKRTFKVSRITHAYLLGARFNSSSLENFLRSKAPAERITQATIRQLVRETPSGYLAIQTSRGSVHMSAQVYSQISDISLLPSDAEAAIALLEKLPALGML